MEKKKKLSCISMNSIPAFLQEYDFLSTLTRKSQWQNLDITVIPQWLSTKFHQLCWLKCWVMPKKPGIEPADVCCVVPPGNVSASVCVWASWI